MTAAPALKARNSSHTPSHNPFEQPLSAYLRHQLEVQLANARQQSIAAHDAITRILQSATAKESGLTLSQAVDIRCLEESECIALERAHIFAGILGLDDRGLSLMQGSRS